MTNGWRRAAVVVAIVLAAGTGCSGSSTDGASPGGPTTSAGTTPPAGPSTSTGTSLAPAPLGSGPDGPAATALVAADAFGSGWTMNPVTRVPDSTSTAFLAVPECADLVPGGGPGAPAVSAASANYTLAGSDVQVQYQVEVYPTAADAATVVQLFGDEELGSCVAAVMEVESGDVTVTERASSALAIPAAADLGLDGVAGAEADLEVAASGTTVLLRVQVVVLQHGPALGVLTVLSEGDTGIDVDEDVLRAAAGSLVALEP